jgi:hypothetical protein
LVFVEFDGDPASRDDHIHVMKTCGRFLLIEPASIKRIAGHSFFESSPHVVRSGPTTDAELKRLAAAVAADETIMVARSAGGLGAQAR